MIPRPSNVLLSPSSASAKSLGEQADARRDGDHRPGFWGHLHGHRVWILQNARTEHAEVIPSESVHTNDLAIRC